MSKELHKRLKKAANIEAINDTSKGRDRKDYSIAAMADHENGFREGFLAGAEFGYKEAIEVAKEWVQKNVPIIHAEEGDYVMVNMGYKNIPMNKYLADFETGMNELWED